MPILTHDLKNDYPKCVLRDLRSTEPRFITISLTPSKDDNFEVKYYVDSTKELINFKNSVLSTCEKFLRNEEERRKNG